MNHPVLSTSGISRKPLRGRCPSSTLLVTLTRAVGGDATWGTFYSAQISCWACSVMAYSFPSSRSTTQQPRT